MVLRCLWNQFMCEISRNAFLLPTALSDDAKMLDKRQNLFKTSLIRCKWGTVMMMDKKNDQSTNNPKKQDQNYKVTFDISPHWSTKIHVCLGWKKNHSFVCKKAIMPWKAIMLICSESWLLMLKTFVRAKSIKIMSMGKISKSTVKLTLRRWINRSGVSSSPSYPIMFPAES